MQTSSTFIPLFRVKLDGLTRSLDGVAKSHYGSKAKPLYILASDIRKMLTENTSMSIHFSFQLKHRTANVHQGSRDRKTHLGISSIYIHFATISGAAAFFANDFHFGSSFPTTQRI